MRAARRAERERRNQWNFFKENGAWLWRLLPPEGRELSSKHSFSNLKECIADARRNGYVLWKSRERRHAS